MSDEFPFSKNGSKYFVGYKNNENVTPLQVLLPWISGCIKNFDEAKLFGIQLGDLVLRHTRFFVSNSIFGVNFRVA